MHPAVPVVSIEHIAVWGRRRIRSQRRGWVSQAGGRAQSGASEQGCSWGLTRLHSPADDPQDVGGVPQLQAVVNTQVHLAGE